MSQKPKTAEQELIDAIIKYMATRLKVPDDLAKGFKLSEGYPRLNFEHGIYSDTINLEVEIERPAR